jgi:hypothetical protein
MAAIADADISIDTSGNIRWTGAATTNRHTVLEFIQWLQDKQDDNQAAGDDILDITVDTPFNRSTDQILTLNSPFNIDDTFALHLYDGSVSQTEPIVGGETLYSGLGIIGPSETGTEYMIIQDGRVLPSFWGTGINPEAAPSLVFSRHLVKSKFAGVKIDNQQITVLARELGDQYRRFPVTLGTGNSVAAIGNGADIFNTTPDATIAGWSTIVNTEGFQELNIDGTGTAGQEFYSQWDKGSQTINDTYERGKWITQRSHIADQTGGTPTGADFVIDNATIVGQGQSFIPLSGGEYLTEARAKIKILAGVPTGEVYAELWDSDDAASQLAEPTGGALAVSEPILASQFTSTYEETIFRFNRINPLTGANQATGLALTNAEYFIVFRHPDGTAGANLSLEGASTDQDSTMNQADDTAAVWTASATDDINITVKSSPVIHGIVGEQFQGINVEVGFDGEVGTGVAEDNIVMWGTLVSYDGLASGPFRPGEYVTFKTGATLKTGGTVLYDDGVDELVVALDTPSASVLTDNDTISSVRGASETTAAVHFPAHTGNGTDDLDFTTGPDEITRVTSGGSFITEGFKVGHKLVVTGSASNNGTYNITSVSATVIGVAETLTAEPNVAATITLAAKDEELSGGTGLLLAKDDNGTTGELYLQVITGVNPVNNNRIRRDDTSGDPLVDYVDATATINTRTLIPEFMGTSTGSNIIGAYGIGFDPADVGSSDRFTSLDNASRVPPNNVSFTVSGIVSGEDRVLVGPRAAGVLDRGQWLINTALTSLTTTAVVLKTGTDTVPFPNAEENWPATGIGADVSRLRIQRDNGIYGRIPYDSHDGTDTFTLGTPVNAAVQIDVVATAGTFTRASGSFLTDGFEPDCTFTGSNFANGGNNAQFTVATVTATVITVKNNTGMVDETGSGDELLTSNGWDFLTTSGGEAAVNNEVFLAFIDVLATATSVSFTGVHGGTNRDLFVRVRDGGGTPIKTFESTSAQFLSTPQTVAAVRTSDA